MTGHFWRLVIFGTIRRLENRKTTPFLGIEDHRYGKVLMKTTIAMTVLTKMKAVESPHTATTSRVNACLRHAASAFFLASDSPSKKPSHASQGLLTALRYRTAQCRQYRIKNHSFHDFPVSRIIGSGICDARLAIISSLNADFSPSQL